MFWSLRYFSKLVQAYLMGLYIKPLKPEQMRKGNILKTPPTVRAGSEEFVKTLLRRTLLLYTIIGVLTKQRRFSKNCISFNHSLIYILQHEKFLQVFYCSLKVINLAHPLEVTSTNGRSIVNSRLISWITSNARTDPVTSFMQKQDFTNHQR